MIRESILFHLSQASMTAREIAAATGFHIDPIKKQLTILWDEEMIHRVPSSTAEPRAHRYALGKTSPSALPRVRLSQRNRTAGTKPEPPPVIARDPLAVRLYGPPPKPKPAPVIRDPFQAMFFGSGK